MTCTSPLLSDALAFGALGTFGGAVVLVGSTLLVVTLRIMLLIVVIFADMLLVRFD